MRGSRHNAREDSNAPSPPENRGRGNLEIFPGTREPEGRAGETGETGIDAREDVQPGLLFSMGALGFPVRNEGCVWRVCAIMGRWSAW